MYHALLYYSDLVWFNGVHDWNSWRKLENAMRMVVRIPVDRVKVEDIETALREILRSYRQDVPFPEHLGPIKTNPQREKPIHIEY